MIATIIVILSIIALGVACYYYRTDETKAVGLKIYEFFKRHRYTRWALIIFVGLWVFGVFLQHEENKDSTIKAVRIGYHKTGPALEFEAQLVEILDSIAVWTGNEKDSRGVVFRFNGTIRESLVGGPFLTKTLGKLYPKKGKWAYFKGESDMIIREGARIKFNGPPYIVTIHTPKIEQTIRFAKNPMRYKIIAHKLPKKAQMVWQQQQSALVFEARRVELLEDIVVQIKGRMVVVAKKGDVALLNGPPYKFTVGKKGEKASLIRGGRYKIAE